jgi:hypothetical protein
LRGVLVQGSDGGGTGLAGMQQNILLSESKIQEMQNDYSSMCEVYEEELGKMESAVRSMAPLAVMQMAQHQEALAASSAQQWEALAKRLGANVTS